MKNIRIILLTVCSIMLLNSCEVLNHKPKDFLAPTTYMTNANEAFLVLTGVYDPLSREALFGGNLAIHFQNDDLHWQDRGNTSTEVFYNNPSPSNDMITKAWNWLYDGIARANYFIANIDKVDMDADLRNRYKGEALFLRGFYYYQLVINWGAVPMRLTPIEDLNKVTIARTPAHEVLKQVVKDMEDAEQYVGLANDKTLAGSRITKSTCQGILARVYLTMAGAMYTEQQLPKTEMYEKALAWAYKVKASGIHSLNTRTVTYNYGDYTPRAASKGGFEYLEVFQRYAADELDHDNLESIWEAMLSGNMQDAANQEAGRISNFYGAQFTKEIKDHKAYYSYSFYRITNTFWNYFVKDTPNDSPFDDLRFRTSATPENYTFDGAQSSIGDVDVNVLREDLSGTDMQISQRFIGKYRREFEKLSYHDKNRTPCNFPLLRYSDVLLMIAESALKVRELGGVTPDGISNIDEEVYSCVSAIRERAGVDATTPAMGTINLQFIQEERARELCFEALRRQDLIRWGIFLSTMKNAGTAMQGATGVNATHQNYSQFAYNNVSERNVLWPIPSTEISLNSLMTQNPGW